MSQAILKKVKELSIYPGINEVSFSDYENALCGFKVKMPLRVKKEISDFALKMTPKLTKDREKNFSVLNCYDFHYSDEKLKLIEINTNASGFLISNLLENKKEEALAYEEDLLEEFIKSFGEKPKKVFISDEDPFQERMLVEFYLYRDFFKRHGIDAEIIKTKDLLKRIKESGDEKVFCYNRDCDFYLEDNLELKEYWNEGKLVLSAHPEAYGMLASKKLLLDLNEESEVFLKTKLLLEENKEELWTKRKSYFFKPLESYGAKGVYSGKSMSKKKFQEVLDQGGYMAQEIHPPGKLIQNEEEWKFDVRAFFSSGEIQKILVRVYKGQVTNFKETGGGFALIDWID